MVMSWGIRRETGGGLSILHLLSAESLCVVLSLVDYQKL
jgi:hypothetical protein